MGLLNTSRLNNLKKAFRAGELEKAYGYATKLDISEVKTAYDLTMIAETYVANHKIGKAIEIYIAVFNKNSSSKICKTIIELSIKVHDVKTAVNYMKELKTIDDDESEIYLYEYKIGKIIAQPDIYLIECLKKYKESEYIDKWALELAKLYYKNNMTEECEKECQSIRLWFAETPYAKKADVLIDACQTGKTYAEMIKSRDNKELGDDTPDIFAQDEDYDSGLSEDEINRFMSAEDDLEDVEFEGDSFDDEFEGDFDEEFDGDCGDVSPDELPETYFENDNYIDNETDSDDDSGDIDEETDDLDLAEEALEGFEAEDASCEEEAGEAGEAVDSDNEDGSFDEEFEGDFDEEEFEGDFDEEFEDDSFDDEFEDEDEKRLRAEYYAGLSRGDKTGAIGSTTHEMTEISFASDDDEELSDDDNEVELGEAVCEIIDEGWKEDDTDSDLGATLVNDRLTHDVIRALKEQESGKLSENGKDLVDEAIEKMMKEDDENE